MARLVVITGPSGVGKGTLKRGLLSELSLPESISATTRLPRQGETDGTEYHFLTRVEFEQRRDSDDFLESAEYAGNLYGTLRSEVEARSDGAKAVVLEIETRGAEQIRDRDPDAILIFIAPPNSAELRKRLEGRGTDDPEQIAVRLAEAERELTLRDEFDTVIVNDDVARATAELVTQVRSRLD
ncbi:MAG: guanylate kinase [Actinomycetes bacterium]|uniref:Guanylate kinase n=1 Tax=freshwater metagenome TaxID=449393 RepID=A0A6J7ENM5_9ZZZZ|nr:guanylate kinase [Actinomycetota bacterium]